MKKQICYISICSLTTKLDKVVNCTDRLLLLKTHDLHVRHITTAKLKVNNESVKKLHITLHYTP